MLKYSKIHKQKKGLIAMFPLDAIQGFNGKRAPTSEEDSKSQRFAVSSGAFDKIVDRPELFELIAKELNAPDFGKSTQVNTEIYEVAQASALPYWKQLLTPSNRAALSLNVRKFFAPNPEALTSLYTKEVKELTFAEMEYLLKVQKAIITANLPRYTNEQVSNLFKQAAAQEADGIVAEIMKTARRGEISAQNLRQVFCQAAENGHEGCLRALIACDRFKDVSVGGFGLALANAAKNGHEGCLRALIACDRFQQIVPEAFQALLWEAAEKGHEGCLKTLIACDHFKGVSVRALCTIFIVAARNGCEGCLKALIDCVRFAEITVGYFTTVLLNAVMNGHEGCVRILIDCDRFKDISVKELGQVLLNAAENDHKGCASALINCARARDILQHFSPQDLLSLFTSCARKGLLDVVQSVIYPVKAIKTKVRLGDLQGILRQAAQNGHVEVVKALVQCQDFPEMNGNDRLSEAIASAAQNGHVEVVKALIEYLNGRSDRWNLRYQGNLNQAVWNAVQNSHVEVVRVLLPYACNSDRLNFLDWAVRDKGSLEILNVFITWILSVTEGFSEESVGIDQVRLHKILKKAADALREDMVRVLLQSRFIQKVSIKDYQDCFIKVVDIARDCHVDIVS